MTQAEILDLAKKALSLDTDTELAKVLGIGQPSVSKIRTGQNNFGPETALQIAEILGVDPAKISAAAYAARASTPKARKAWERAATLCTLLSVASVIYFTAIPNALAAPYHNVTPNTILTAWNLFIMSTRRRLKAAVEVTVKALADFLLTRGFCSA